MLNQVVFFCGIINRAPSAEKNRVFWTDNKNNEEKKSTHHFFLFYAVFPFAEWAPAGPSVRFVTLFFSLSSMKLAKQNTTTETGTGHFFFTFQLLCIFLAHDGSFACASLYYMSRTASDFSPPIGTINIENRCCCSVVVV